MKVSVIVAVTVLGKNTVLQSSLITPDTPKTAAVVLELLEPLFGRGHTLWLDFFNSPELARKLKIEHSTDCVGTLKLNRMDVPKEVKDKKLGKGGNHSQTFESSNSTKMA